MGTMSLAEGLTSRRELSLRWVLELTRASGDHGRAGGRGGDVHVVTLPAEHQVWEVNS